jgi:hypothetical protein
MIFATSLVCIAREAGAAGFLPDGVAPEAVSEAPSVVSLGAEPVVCVAVITGRKAADRSDKIITAHNRGFLFAKANGLKLGRGALEISPRYQEPDGSWQTDACRSLQTLPGETYPDASDLKFYEVPAGRAVQALHRGSHDLIDRTIDKVEAYIASQGLRRVGPLVEYHFNHKPPEEVDQQISVVTVYVE